MDITDTLFSFSSRNPEASKRDFGHALLIAGSRGKVGAAILSAKACMRSGVGLLTVHLPSCGVLPMHAACPEVMVEADEAEYYISRLETFHYQAVGLGPGIGVLPSHVAWMRQLFEHAIPLVVDADALNMLARYPDLFADLPAESVLTPHADEFARLCADGDASAFARRYKVYLVLKGHRTRVYTPEGKVYFNTTGNPGMATGGSGDVLTGVILGLLAQGYDPETAAIRGIFEHGKAGDRAAQHRGEASMIAGDIIDFLHL